MSYQVERDTFISQAAREGLSVEVARKLLRYATTLQRLAECQCNGDWPYNGDRDRPSAVESVCGTCEGTGRVMPTLQGCMSDQCEDCNGNGKTWHRDVERDKRHDSRYTTCPKCEASGVSKSVMRTSSELWNEEKTLANGVTVAMRGKVCPDCRTQELVNELLANVWTESPEKSVKGSFEAKFNGDPRGAVLTLSTPNYPWTEDGRGRGLYVPAGKSR